MLLLLDSYVIVYRESVMDVDKNLLLLHFLSRVKTAERDQCWEWDGPLNSYGYGVYNNRKHGYDQSGAHRVAYELFHGHIPDGYFVCHRCDNPACVNPFHIFAGRPKDNTKDMVKKGRDRFTGRKRAISDETLLAVFRSSLGPKSAASEFGVSRTVYYMIKSSSPNFYSNRVRKLLHPRRKLKRPV